MSERSTADPARNGDKLRGMVRRITFRSPDNGFTVLRLEPGEGPGSGSGLPSADPVTVVGYFPDLPEGEMIEVEGSWVNHPRWGRQFQAESFQVVAPETEIGLQRYLASGVIKGLGPATAQKLVEHFGARTLDVIEQEPERLCEVPGIGPKKAAAIHQGLVRRRSVERVMIFLQGHGVSPAYAARIYKEYGDAAIAVVKANPYRLAQEVFGIGFRMADRLARSLGVEETSPQRLAAGLTYTLDRAASEGHVYLPRGQLVAAAAKELGVAAEEVEAVLGQMLAEGRLVIRPGVGRLEGRMDADPAEDAVFRPELDAAESAVAQRLARLALSGHQDPAAMDEESLRREREAIRYEAAQAGLSLTPEQEEAVRQGLNAGLLVITGGPGTGKTTIVRVLLSLLKRLKKKVLLACPTGRAAQRLAEATGHEAQTVHRLLEFGYEEGVGLVFQRHEDNPLDADVVLIDEASMMDIWLTHHLLKALRPGTRLILVGDVDQLPSVGPGNVLRDILRCEGVERVRLSRIFRQGEKSGIVEAAHAVLAGKEPAGRGSRDFFLLEEKDPQRVAELIVDLVARRIPEYLGCDPVDDIQVLSPMRRTQTGVEQLNRLLQERLNPAGGRLGPGTGSGLGWSLEADPGMAEVPAGAASASMEVGEAAAEPVPYRLGDKVMQTRNNYRKRVFNGDIGRVVAVDPEERTLRVAFPGPDGPQVVEYDDSDWDELTLAYCISVHKSQGSEYMAVVVPITTQHYVMLRRNLLYTAITRAKRMVVLVGTRQAVRLAVANAVEERRYSLLSHRMRQAMAGLEWLG